MHFVIYVTWCKFICESINVNVQWYVVIKIAFIFLSILIFQVVFQFEIFFILEVVFIFRLSILPSSVQVQCQSNWELRLVL